MSDVCCGRCGHFWDWHEPERCRGAYLIGLKVTPCNCSFLPAPTTKEQQP